MTKPILYEDGRFIPSTRLGVFLHSFGLAVGLWGYFGFIPEYVVIGGMCCFMIDSVRIIEHLALYRVLRLRTYLYIFTFPLLWTEFGFLRGLALTALTSATLLFLFDLWVSFAPPLTFETKRASHKRGSRNNTD